MKKIPIILLVVCVITTILFLYLYIAEMYRGKDDRRAKARLEKELEMEKSQIKKYDSIISRLKDERLEFLYEAEDLRAKITKLEEEIPSLSHEPESYPYEEVELDAAESEAAENGQPSPDEKTKNGFNQFMKSSAARKIVRDQQITQVDMVYGDLYDDLSLNQNDITTFRGFVADWIMNEIELTMLRLGDDTSGTINRERQEKLEEKDEEITAGLKALLGDEGFASCEEYNQTFYERLKLYQFREQLAGKDHLGLDEDQEYDLLTAMEEVRENTPFQSNLDDADMSDGDLPLKKKMNMVLKHHEELDKGLLDRARQFLTDEQLQELKTFQKDQLRLTEWHFDMAAKMFLPNQIKKEGESEEEEE